MDDGPPTGNRGNRKHFSITFLLIVPFIKKVTSRKRNPQLATYHASHEQANNMHTTQAFRQLLQRHFHSILIRPLYKSVLPGFLSYLGLLIQYRFPGRRTGGKVWSNFLGGSCTATGTYISKSLVCDVIIVGPYLDLHVLVRFFPLTLQCSSQPSIRSSCSPVGTSPASIRTL